MKSLPGRALLLGLPLCLAAKEPESVPLSLDTDVNWYGYDGTWSAVNIYVGSELDTVSLFPSTVDRQTWLIGGGGCENSSLSDCPSKRGGLYRPYNSSAWKSSGERASLRNQSTRANYGTDTILVDFTEVPNDPIVIVNETDTWIGLLGLGMSLDDHADLSNLSLMEQAFANDTTAPSGTYGYTAGAHYRLKGVPVSLTIGGVDKNRYTTNSAVFHLTGTKPPVVSLSTISISATEDGNDTLTNHEISTSGPGTNSFYTLDSSTTYIWLPEDAFDAFGRAFNLTYDDDVGFYTYGNDTSLRKRLLGMNISLTFSISDFPEGSQNVNITVPFQAFDHSLTYPFPYLPSEYENTSLPYIPVKRASTTDDQRIGRVFFQEAYLAVDYEKEQFSLYQASFDEEVLANNSKDIVPIQSYYDDALGALLGRKGLSKGAKAGIGVGAGVGGILLIGGAVWAFLYFRKRRQATNEARDGKGKMADDMSTSDSTSPIRRSGARDTDHELKPKPPHEMSSDAAHAVYELPGSELAELDAGPSFLRHVRDEDPGPTPTKTAPRHVSRHSETQSSIAESLASRIAESSDGESDGPAPAKGHHHASPPSYTP